MNEIQLAIVEAGSHKAVPDLIYYEGFKHIPDNTLSDITKLFNEVLLQGSLPVDWKKNVTLPIYMSGDPLSSSNYRPITLTPAR